jgi:site-specific recombinase XerD
MSGRIEKDKLIEKKITYIIKGQPDVITRYSKSFGNKTYNTKKSYINHAINFCNYLKNEFNLDVNSIKNIKDLNYSHIVAYMDYTSNHMPNGEYINKEAGTCAAEFYAIKHFCKYLKLCRYIDFNPCDEVEVPKDKKIHKIISLSEDEIQIIKNNINNGVGNNRAKGKQFKWKKRDLCIILLGITTGLRVSAISNIDISDIDFENKTLRTIEKGGYERTIYLSDKLIEVINEWLKDRSILLGNNICDALFISVQKQRIHTNTIRDLLKKYTYNIDKKITPHKLRSTAATNLYDVTGDIYLVADVLGHHNIQNTKRYAAISNSRKQYAADTLSKLI